MTPTDNSGLAEAAGMEVDDLVIEILIKRLADIYNEVPQAIRDKYTVYLQAIKNELEARDQTVKTIRTAYQQRLRKKDDALSKIATTYGKPKFGKVDNKKACRHMRQLAREALK